MMLFEIRHKISNFRHQKRSFWNLNIDGNVTDGKKKIRRDGWTKDIHEWERTLKLILPSILIWFDLEHSFRLWTSNFHNMYVDILSPHFSTTSHNSTFATSTTSIDLKSGPDNFLDSQTVLNAWSLVNVLKHGKTESILIFGYLGWSSVRDETLVNLKCLRYRLLQSDYVSCEVPTIVNKYTFWIRFDVKINDEVYV